ncbi:hypothetical protein [Acidithiobacillus sp.]|uniref:hypothetical protein n=1 Tax=Acidithiobacillus sp. TaxID=1872118 RepID=UPI0025BBCD2F|nr:hypothetical protein [Acidithiobacillus sp.]MCK9188518.1 hypothetical protein [Acidithiobacillus sp.]MCK9358939.1 hypothetical protein [Acidithiobacillus sp.]
MKKPIYNALFTALIAAPFIALGGLVHEVAPLRPTTTTSVARPVVSSGLRMMGDAQMVMGHVEQADWLLLTPEEPAHQSSAAPHRQYASVTVRSL